MFKALKKAVSKFINSLAKSSQKEFGNERLDCCKLDRPNNKE
ncbi:LDCC motif putative metal-binding protein [Lutispora saccharofermentans]|nr:LDCC motif putative metal-binding protein [Lutispora saccharofermentans]